MHRYATRLIIGLLLAPALIVGTLVLGAIAALIIGAAVALGAVPVRAQEAPPYDATTAAADAAARAARFSAPLAISDFAGSWNHHGFGMTIQPDGTAEAAWRTYRSDDGDRPETPKGHAWVRFTRAEGRTLYGTVTGSTDPSGLANGPITLTEYDYGIGELLDSGRTPDQASHVLGPRYQDAPDWVKRLHIFGA